jgi:hypothetical protein
LALHPRGRYELMLDLGQRVGRIESAMASQLELANANITSAQTARASGARATFNR